MPVAAGNHWHLCCHVWSKADGGTLETLTVKSSDYKGNQWLHGYVCLKRATRDGSCPQQHWGPRTNEDVFLGGMSGLDVVGPAETLYAPGKTETCNLTQCSKKPSVPMKLFLSKWSMGTVSIPTPEPSPQCGDVQFLRC